jgi:hypothetical protein
MGRRTHAEIALYKQVNHVDYAASITETNTAFSVPIYLEASIISLASTFLSSLIPLADRTQTTI